MEQIQIVSRTRVRVIFVLRFIRRRKDDNVDIIIGTLSFPPFVETEQFFFFLLSEVRHKQCIYNE